MSAKEIILKVRIDGANEELNKLNLLQEEINALAIQKKALNEQQKALTEAIKAGTITEEEATQQAKELAAAQVELNLITKETKKEFSEAEKALLNQGKAMDVAEGSIAAMRLELAASQKAYINLSQAERENAAVGGVMQKQIKAQSDELKKLEKEIGITSRSVGDYGQAVVGILPMFGSFGQSMQMVVGNLGQIKQSLQGVKGLLGEFIDKINGGVPAPTKLGKAFQFLKVAIASSGIGALVIIIGTLVTAILSTERGMDGLMRRLSPVIGVFKGLFGLIQDVGLATFDRLREAFNNPIETLKALGDAITTNIINRFKGVILYIKSGGNLLVETFRLMGLGVKKALSGVPILGSGIDQAALKKDLAEAKKNVLQASKDMAQAAIQVGTGLDKSQQASIAATGKALTGRLAAQAKIQSQIFELGEKIEEIEINRQQIIDETNEKIQEQREIATDANRSSKDRLAASQKAVKLVDELTAKERVYFQAKVDLAHLENQQFDRGEEGRKKESEARAELSKLEASATKQKIKLGAVARQIIKDENAAQIKAVEDAKKAQIEAQKQIEENKLGSEKRMHDATVARYDAELKMLELNHNLDLVTKKQTDEEKYAAELAYQEKVAALQMTRVKEMAAFELKEAQRANKELLDNKKIDQAEFDRLQLEAKAAYDVKIKEQEVQSLVEKETLKNEHQKEIDEKEADRVKELEERKAENQKQIRTAAIDAIDQAQNIVFQNQNRRIDAGLKREIDALNIKRTKGEISEEEFDKQKLELEKKAFERKKRLDIAQALINGALAVTRISADVPKGDYGIATGIMIAAQIVQTGAQVAAIASQKFAKGGLLVGGSHAQGGIPINVGGSMIEAEGGEAIINKRSTRAFAPILSAINQAGGGVPIPSISGLRTFANGGTIAATQNALQPFNSQQLRDEITAGVVESIGAIRVVNVASETKGVNDRQNKIENFASF